MAPCIPVNRTVRSSRQSIDYLTLNDGLDDDIPISPKHHKRNTHRPRSKPSATRQASQKYEGRSPPTLPAIPVSTKPAELPAVPSRAKPAELPSIPDKKQFSDLVLEQDSSQDTIIESEAGAANAEEELDAANVLLSLGYIRDGTQDNENVNLMLIGGQNVPIDAAPEPIKLYQVSIDNAIANLIQAEEQNKKSDQSMEKKLDADDDTGIMTKPQRAAEDGPTVNGALKTKIYTLKKKLIINVIPPNAVNAKKSEDQ